MAPFDTETLHRWIGSLSAASSMFIVSYLLYQKCHSGSLSFNEALYLNIAISDALDSISNIMGKTSGQSILCLIQGYVGQCGGISSLLWACITAKILYDIIYRNTKTSDLNMNKITIQIWCISIVCFTFPPFNLYPLFEITYGNSGNDVCWMKRENWIDFVWRFMLFYMPLWFIISYLLFVYIQIWRKFDIFKSKKELITIGFFPLILIVCFIPATIHRFWDLLHRIGVVKEVSIIIIVIHAASTTIYGFIDSIVMCCILSNCRWKYHVFRRHTTNNNNNNCDNDTTDNKSNGMELNTDLHQLLEINRNTSLPSVVEDQISGNQSTERHTSSTTQFGHLRSEQHPL